MAKFVLAGKADCPYYAKAELLADYLQKNLPNFKVHKITQHPDDWEKWLQEICEKNAWKHKRSPIIWRELLDRGGKGLLLGGFNDFLEHAQILNYVVIDEFEPHADANLLCNRQHYYNITSDMLTPEMLQIAKENLQTHIETDKEEEELRSMINPLHIWINSASGHACYHLIPLLVNGEIFGMETEISLHLLDRSNCEEILHGVAMETQDLASPVLRSVSLHTDLDGAFLHADVIILLDDILQETIPTLEECIRQVNQQCEVYGALIDKNAKSTVKILVMGHTFVNLKALMIMTHTPSINPQNIVTVAMLLENEAKSMLARKLNMHSAGIKNLVIWGNISGNSYVDLSRTELFHYDSAIWGPPDFFRPLLDVLFDRKWMHTEFITALSTLGSAVHQCLGIAPAHVITTLLRYWYQDSPPGEIVSLGVLSEGQCGIPAGIVYAMPVTFQNGSWRVLTEVPLSEKTQEYLQILACDLIREKQVALGEMLEMYPQRRVVPLCYSDEEQTSTSKEELKLSDSGQKIALEKGQEELFQGDLPITVTPGLPESEGELHESKSVEEGNIEDLIDDDVFEVSPDML